MSIGDKCRQTYFYTLETPPFNSWWVNTPAIENVVCVYSPLRLPHYPPLWSAGFSLRSAASSRRINLFDRFGRTISTSGSCNVR